MKTTQLYTKKKNRANLLLFITISMRILNTQQKYVRLMNITTTNKKKSVKLK
jgi:hypothetical protein